MDNKKVFIVHAVDTEGPLTESWKETVKRFNEIIKPKKKIKYKSELLQYLEGNKSNKKIKKNFNYHLLNYNNSWGEINKMLRDLKKSKLRRKLLDHNKNEYKITWHCMDHVNYKTNLRKRELGYHRIFDFYKNYIQKNNLRDELQFHFHPMSINEDCHRDGYLLMRNDNLYQIMSRRILDRKWFPSSFRAGFHSERPDLHTFLEHYIPFDLSNINKDKHIHQNSKPHLKSLGYDWRRAPDKWEIYNPDFYDYQKKGICRRYIGRVLSIMDRTVAISQKEVDSAFRRANNNQRTMLAVTNHDFRNINHEIDYFLNMIRLSSKKFPKVKFYYNTTSEGFQNCLRLKKSKNNLFKIKIKKISDKSFSIKAINGKVFGPQPFLAFKLKNGRYVHDNLNFDLKYKNLWYYTFSDQHNVNIKELKSIGVGACDKNGNTSVDIIEFT